MSNEAQFVAVFALIVGGITFAIILAFTAESAGAGQGIGSQQLRDKGVINLAGSPAIEPIGQAACAGAACTYAVNVQDLFLKSKAQIQALITAKLESSEEKYFPCSFADELFSRVPCGITPEGTRFDYNTFFQDGRDKLPLLLNFSRHRIVRTLLWDKQTVQVGNFSVFARDATLSLPLLKDNIGKRFTVRCRDNNLGERTRLRPGDETTFHMCGGSLHIFYEPDKKDRDFACIYIEAEGGGGKEARPWEGNGMDLSLHLWKLPAEAEGDASKWACGGIKGLPPVTGTTFSIESALIDPACAESFTGLVGLSVPVKAFDITQPSQHAADTSEKCGSALRAE